MTEKHVQWIKIAEHINEIVFAENQIALIETGEKNLCIGKHHENYFAFAEKCPHAGGLLADGFIDALGNVVCPLHQYRYNLKNGYNSSGEGYFLRTMPVEIRSDGVFVGVKNSFK